MARSGLLPLVSATDRELARLQIVAATAAYEAGTEPAPFPIMPRPFSDSLDAKRAIYRAHRSGKVEAFEGAVIRAGEQLGMEALLRILTPIALRSYVGEARAHVILWLAYRHATPDFGRTAIDLLRAKIRMIGEEPETELRGLDGDVSDKILPSNPEILARQIVTRLLEPPAYPTPYGGARQILEKSEAAKLTDQLFGNMFRYRFSGAHIEAAFRALNRLCCHVMLQEDPSLARREWASMLIMVQASWGLARHFGHERTALAATLTRVTAWRSSLNIPYTELDPDHVPEKTDKPLARALQHTPDIAAAAAWHAPHEDKSEIMRLLASEAAIRIDRDLNLYVQACLESCVLDPAGTDLYLAAAAYLTAHWLPEAPRAQIPEHLTANRRIPNLSPANR